MIALARKTLVHEWRRFIPSVFAVGFSGVLLAMQAALVLGIFGSAALYVTASSADLWIGYPGTQSVNFGRTIGRDVTCACAWTRHHCRRALRLGRWRLALQHAGRRRGQRTRRRRVGLPVRHCHR